MGSCVGSGEVVDVGSDEGFVGTELPVSEDAPEEAPFSEETVFSSPEAGSSLSIRTLLLPALPKNLIFAPGTKAAAYILALLSFFAPTILPS